MGRKRIEIKLIKNERLRNITYNKRKKGLLKKLVELSIICGISAKLELRDSLGNLIMIDAGSKETQEPISVPQNKIIVFTPEDYPMFEGFQKIKNKASQLSQEKDIDKKSSLDMNISNPLIEIEASNKIQENQIKNNLDDRHKFFQPPSSPAITSFPAVNTGVPQFNLTNNQIPTDYRFYIPNLQFNSQLNYADIQYNQLINSFFQGRL